VSNDDCHKNDYCNKKKCPSCSLGEIQIHIFSIRIRFYKVKNRLTFIVVFITLEQIMNKALSRWLIIAVITCLSSISGVFESYSASPVSFASPQIIHKKKQRAKIQSTQIQQLHIGQNSVPQIFISPTVVQPEAWGKAQQVDEHTWTIKVGDDAVMATAQEVLSALNTYRQQHGRGGLQWDDRLGEYAKSRSDYFLSTGKLDGHAGFSDYLDKQDGFTKLGFRSIGENSSLGYKQSGVHLIEWVYAGDKPHDDNQLDTKWHFVGIGVSGTATDLIFGGEKL
jgi:uncharacterized protein YkwD